MSEECPKVTRHRRHKILIDSPGPKDLMHGTSKLDKLCIDEIELQGRAVLIRVDFNVPMEDKDNADDDAHAKTVIADDQRIRAALPTIEYALSKHAKRIVLMSHLGRPNGEPNQRYSLKPVARRLEELLKQKIVFVTDCVGREVEEQCVEGAEGECQILLLENLRFHWEEEGKTDGDKKTQEADIKRFADSLSKLGDVYINDAFGTLHRPHASITGITCPVRAAGFLVQKELKAFEALLHPPSEKIDAAILGGAKVSDKIALIENLMPKLGTLKSIGKSMFDPVGTKHVARIVAAAKENQVRLVFPVDFRCACDLGSSDVRVFTNSIPEDMAGYDIGPESERLFANALEGAKKVLWNGPMGVFERPAFAHGTSSILSVLAKLTRDGATTVVGGGDSANAVHQLGSEHEVTHVSTGGGASLELLEGRELPGISHLTGRKGN